MVSLKRYNPETTFFTSDTHFCHEWTLKMGLRDFPDIKTMDKVMVDNWNSVVKPGDTVFHLGDFAFGKKQQINNVLYRLNGQIHLIYGNHDLEFYDIFYNKKFASRSFQQCIRMDKYKITLNHYPFLCFPNRKNFVQLFGHVHSRQDGIPVTEDHLKLVHLHPNQLEVCADLHNLTPVPGTKILDCLNNRN